MAPGRGISQKPDIRRPDRQTLSLPVKDLPPGPLPNAALGVGRTSRADGSYAIENGPSGFDSAAPAYAE
jgi:hypothetical protein